jgi:glycerol kinase
VSSPLVLAIDQGTTNTKAMVVASDGDVRAWSSRRVGIEFPRPGWVQADANEIWATVQDVTADCLRQIPADTVQTVGLSNQRESVVAWDRATGAPLGPVISWQCGRTAAICAELRDDGHAELVSDRTGLVLDPMFSASKMAWLLDEIDRGRQRADGGEICLGTIDSWLIWNLSGGQRFLTDHTNASRTLLFDLTRLDWDDELLDLFGIPRCALPDIRASISPFACTTLHGGLPLDGVAGDSHAALVGHHVLAPGAVKATFGTGTSVMAPVPALTRSSRLSSTIAWSRRGDDGDQPTYALEGNVYATGAALEWTAALLGLGDDVGALDKLAGSCPSSAGVSFVPALSGLGAPHWAPHARGLISGLTRAAGPPEVARAAFEAVAHQLVDVLECMETALGVQVAAVHVDGGAIRSDLLAALVADLSGTHVIRNDGQDVAALGAALLAGVGAGVWSDLQATTELPTPTTPFQPRLQDAARREQRDVWRETIRRAVVPGTG